MKSKSFDLKRSSSDKGKTNKSFEFISFYKTAAETNNSVSEKQKAGNGTGKENSFTAKSKYETPTQASSADTKIKHKKRNKQELLDISCINIEGPSIDTNLHKSSPLNQSRVTSTPRASDVKNQVKSIMKNSSIMSDAPVDESWLRNSKPKKRNKSVSFMLDDNEEIVKKKTKSNESLVADKRKQEKPSLVKGSCAKVVSKIKKMKKGKEPVVEKANLVGDSMKKEPVSENQSKDSVTPDTAKSADDDKNVQVNLEKKKKFRKIKKQKTEEKSDAAEMDNNNEDQVENKNKKLRKKKQTKKLLQSTDTAETDEPAAKSRKKDVKPEVIAENLENLTIGDNPHTLTTLLDEMTVADKDKRKKIKRKQKKEKDTKTEPSTENANDKTGEVKEKVKWKKRKWNKDKKGDMDGESVPTTVIVENLPLSMMCNYKKVLAEHFEKCGLIKRIGVAEVNLSENSMVFATTINFNSDGAATQALEDDGAVLEGNKIRVIRTLPPTETTIVLHSYAALSDQSICSTFAAAGKIRNIRHLIKGKKAIDTVFVEFDGPEAVNRAIEITKGAKVGGKKLHVEKFQVRKKKEPKPQAESENEGDSEESNE